MVCRPSKFVGLASAGFAMAGCTSVLGYGDFDFANDVDIDASRTDAAEPGDAAADTIARDRCVPNCTARQCGPDGCDGSCGPACADPTFCNGAGQCECPSAPLQVRFLGTGASNWTSSNVRALASILVNGNMIVDMSCPSHETSAAIATSVDPTTDPNCGVHRLDTWGIDKNGIDTLLVTHHHPDHIDMRLVTQFAQSRAPTAPKLTLYGGNAVVSKANGAALGLINVVHLDRNISVDIGPYTVTPLLAVHDDCAAANPDASNNEPYVYVIRYKNNGTTFLYGTDSDCFAGNTLTTLQHSKLDLVIREGTWANDAWCPAEYCVGCCLSCGTSTHMDFARVRSERQGLIDNGAVQPGTPYWVTHIAYKENCEPTCDPGPGLDVATDNSQLEMYASCHR